MAAECMQLPSENAQIKRILLCIHRYVKWEMCEVKRTILDCITVNYLEIIAIGNQVLICIFEKR